MDDKKEKFKEDLCDLMQRSAGIDVTFIVGMLEATKFSVLRQCIVDTEDSNV